MNDLTRCMAIIHDDSKPSNTSQLKRCANASKWAYRKDASIVYCWTHCNDRIGHYREITR